MASTIGSHEYHTDELDTRRNEGQSLGDGESAARDRWRIRETHPAYLARQRALAEIEGLKTVSPYNWAIGITFVVVMGVVAYLLPRYEWGVNVLLLIFLADAIARRVNKQVLVAQNQQIIREWEVHSYLLTLSEKLDRMRDR